MTAARARILVLTYTTFAQEPRALKQVQFLEGDHDVTTAGFGDAPFPGVPHVELPGVALQRWGVLGRLLAGGLLAVRLFRPLAWLSSLDKTTARVLGSGEWDIVIAHDLKTLDAALALRPKRGVVLDLHEYAPRQEEQDLMWRLLVAPYFRWMCRTKVHQAAAVVTVGKGIADEYLREFGFESTMVVNSTPYQELSPRNVGAPLRLVHSGGVSAQRRLDIIIRGVLESSADVTLDLFLVGESSLIGQLKALAGDDPRIRFKDPVPYARLVKTLNEYDLGVHILPPVNFNHLWALPNKFFDYVQARLGLIVGPSPEMARYVQECGLGIVLPDFEASSLSLALDSLGAEQAAAYKAASASHARALSSESQVEIWQELVAALLAGRMQPQG